VYFAFDYQDVFRVNQFRRSGQFLASSSAGFVDASQWEKLKRQSDQAIKRAIDESLRGTSVTVVCIGRRTSRRPWVKYEIVESIRLGKGLLGIHLNTLLRGPVPEGLSRAGAKVYVWNHTRFPAWVEAAAAKVGR
jgi:MTH538 TIR-like domain (DUF1863)